MKQKKNKEEHWCKFCGKETKNKVYCNQKCHNLGQTTVKKKRYCILCGEEIKGQGDKYCTQKCHYSDPVSNKLRSERSTKQWSSLDLRKAASDRRKEYFSDPKHREEASESRKGEKHPFYGKKHSAKTISIMQNKAKEVGSNPVVKERRRKGQERRWSKLEEHEKASKGQEKAYSDPKRHETQSNGANKRWMKKEEHEKQSKRQIKYYADHPERKKTGKNNPNYNPNKPEFERYGCNCKFKFNLGDFLDEFDLKKVRGIYHLKNNKSKDGYTRDHMYSIFDGFKNNIDPKIISHPANCQLITMSENSKKKDKSCITLDELLERIRLWNIKYGEYTGN